METNKKALEIADLINRNRRDELSENEKQTLKEWLEANEQNRALYNSLMREQDALQEELNFLSGVNVQQAWQKVARATGQPITPEAKVIPIWQKFSTWRNVAAALVLLIMVAVVYQYKNNDNNQVTPATIAATTDQPDQLGDDRAILVLQDGSVVDLDSLHNGTIRELNGVKVITEDGVVRFDATALAVPENSEIIAYNTISTPRGGQYQVVLPDGSKVWLNAASSLRFPTAFTGNERRVELNGEAYFDVVKDKKQFIVETGEVDVSVLGTSFNVSAYEDDHDISTTLVTGHVQLSGASLTSVTDLTPGKRAVYKKASKNMMVSQVDTEIYTVWKEGKFYFEQEELETIIKKLSRWYEIDPVYIDQKSKTKTFTGVVYKNKPLDHLLTMISQTTNVSFEKKGNKLLIKRK